MSFQKSTRVLKQDVLSICGELTDGTSPFDAQAVAYLDKVYQALISGNNIFETSCQEPWVWAQSKTPILLTLKAPHTGSATLTNGSSSGVFSSAPTISLEGRHLSIEGQEDIYRISQHTAASTSFSLDQDYLESTGSYNYSAYKYDYDAFNDTIIINSKNCKIDFSEGGSQLTATLTSGSYTPTTLCTEIDTRLTAAGSQTYTVTFNSITRKFTIVQGGTTFSLLFATGTNAYISASGVLGFDVEDKTLALTYTSSYALSGIARISKPITTYKSAVTYDQSARDSNKIFMIDDNTFVRDYPIGQMGLTMPDKFCPIEINPDGLWTIRFNGSVQEDTRVELNHIPVARSLKDNVNSFPLVPGNFSDFLVYGAAHFLQTDKSDSKASDSATKAVAQLKALIAFNRQGSQVAGNNFGRVIPRMNGTNRSNRTGSAY